MRIVLDTNVFVSAVFFGGVPGRILEHDGWKSVRVLRPRQFADEFLSDR